MLKAASQLADTPKEGKFYYYSADDIDVPSDFYLSLGTYVWIPAVDSFRDLCC